jgi:two-component system OmpR family sensor kinase
MAATASSPAGNPPAETCRTPAGLRAMVTLVEEEFNRRGKAEERLREFITAASHELRTPLTTISGYAQLVRLGALESPLQLDAAMERVQQEAARMTLLIDELLLLARLDHGRPLERVRVDLARLCSEVVADARVCAPEHVISYTVQLDAHEVRGDPNRLRQVLINLLYNVRSHTPPEASVRVELTRDGPWQVIDVIDDGPGIPQEFRERVFERFFQVERQPHQAQDHGAPHSGTGLGLSVVAAIVESHGGTVRIEPSERGAWFRVRLPDRTLISL